jgi:hypothetical protein
LQNSETLEGIPEAKKAADIPRVSCRGKGMEPQGEDTESGREKAALERWCQLLV